MMKAGLSVIALAVLWLVFDLDPTMILMLAIALGVLFLGIFKEYEPLLLIPIGFGMFAANLPGGYMTSNYFDVNLIEKESVSSKRIKFTVPHEKNAALYLNEGQLSWEGAAGVELGKFNYQKDSITLKPSEGVNFSVNGYQAKGENGVYLDDGDTIEWDGRIFTVVYEGGLLNLLYTNLLKSGIIPPLIFMGVGAMTDFTPLLRNIGLAFYGAAAQIGIFMVFFMSLVFGFLPKQAACLGIIGGADGPTAVFLTTKLAPELLGPIAVAAYSYMALVPVIIPLVVNRLTTPEERKINMRAQEKASGETPINVSRRAKIAFPIMVTLICGVFVPSSAPLIGMLMFGNLVKEVTIPYVQDRLAGVAKGALINVMTIFLGLSVGATMDAQTFLNMRTLGIIAGGFLAFAISVAGGITGAQIYNKFAKSMGWKLTNPLIGATGLSAVPMASRVANEIALKEDPNNNIIHYCMASNIAGVIGSAVAAGYFLSVLS